jgi:hypothetical protein
MSSKFEYSGIHRDCILMSEGAPDEVAKRLESFGRQEDIDRHSIPEYLALRRNNRRVDLALAEHARSRFVLSRLYRRSGQAMRVVICGNAWFWNWNRVFDCTDAELRAICENQNIGPRHSKKILDAWCGWPEARGNSSGTIDHDRFEAAVRGFASNPYFHRNPFHSTDYPGDDWYLSISYDLLWNISSYAPVTWRWAELLCELYEKLYIFSGPEGGIEPILSRWWPTHLRAQEAPEDPECPFRLLRMRLLKRLKVPTVDMLRNEDPAVRMAFWANFDPLNFHDFEWSDGLFGDDLRNIYYYALMQNDNIWKSEQGRVKVIELLTVYQDNNSPCPLIEEAESRIALRKATHPEWFT